MSSTGVSACPCMLSKMDGDTAGPRALCVVGVVRANRVCPAAVSGFRNLKAFQPPTVWLSRVLPAWAVVARGGAHVDRDTEEAERKIREDDFTLEDSESVAHHQENGPNRANPRFPGMGLKEALAQRDAVDEGQVRVEAIINSITPIHQRQPQEAQLRRGSGTKVEELFESGFVRC